MGRERSQLNAETLAGQPEGIGTVSPRRLLVTATVLVLLAALVALLASCGSPASAKPHSGPAVVTSLPATIPSGGVVWHIQPGEDLIMMPAGQVNSDRLKLKTVAAALAGGWDTVPGSHSGVLCRATTPHDSTTAVPHKIRNRLCWVLCYTYATPVPAPNFGPPGSASASPQLVTKDVVLLDAQTGDFLLGWNAP